MFFSKLSLAVAAAAAVTGPSVSSVSAAPLAGLPFVATALPPTCMVPVAQVLALVTTSGLDLTNAWQRVIPTTALSAAQAQVCLASLKSTVNVSLLASITSGAHSLPVVGSIVNGVGSGVGSGSPVKSIPVIGNLIPKLPLLGRRTDSVSVSKNAAVTVNAGATVSASLTETQKQVQACMTQIYAIQANTALTAGTKIQQLVQATFNLQLVLIQLLAQGNVLARTTVVNALAIVLVQINALKTSAATTTVQLSSQTASFVSQIETITAQALYSCVPSAQDILGLPTAAITVTSIVSKLRATAVSAGVAVAAMVTGSGSGSIHVRAAVNELSTLALEVCEIYGQAICHEIAQRYHA